MITSKKFSDKIEELWELIEESKVGMLVTQRPNGFLRSRPMAIVQDEFNDQTLHFLSNESTVKMDEIRKNPDVLMDFMCPEKNIFVTINGSASISRDQNLMKQLWNSRTQTWFPKGLEDPNLKVISIVVEDAEYWHNPDGVFTSAFKLLSAKIDGKRPDLGKHQVI